MNTKIKLKKLIWKVLLPMAEFHVKIAARAYFVGPELKDALWACRRLQTKQVAVTVSYWNALDESTQKVAAEYHSILDAFAKEKFNAYLSMKAPFIGFDQELFGKIVEQSRTSGQPLHFDAQEYNEIDRVFAMIDSARARGIDIGCTLPGRWVRSVADADWAVERQVRVRVVKGQLADPSEPEDAPEPDLREGFLAVIDRLAGRAKHVAVATHDGSLAREALERLQRKRTSCSLELLYGLPMGPSWKVARELGVEIRVYIPYGHGFLPYWMSQGFKKPIVFWWMLRDMCRSAVGGADVFRD